MDAHELLADMDWLSRLAHRLVRDPALADDAVQEAWLAAKRRLDARGMGERPDRGLLARTLRGMILHARRGAQRRRFHEGQAARHEALPSTDELLLVGELQQNLWQHLRRLDEPYRSTLLLRFQAGLTPAEIGVRSSEKEDTVRWRVRRGLELLKESLEVEEGGAGLMGLVPVAALGIHPLKASAGSVGGAASVGKAVSLGAAVQASGALWMTHKILVTVGAAVLLLVGAMYLLPSDAEPLVPGDTQPVLAAGGQAALESVSDSDSRGFSSDAPAALRESLPVIPESQPDAVAVEGTVLAGRVVDASGIPIAGAPVVASVHMGWRRESETNQRGEFELPCPSESARVLLLVPAFEFYQEKGLTLGSDASCSFPPLSIPRIEVGDIALKTGAVIVGRLIDESGDAVTDATLTAEPALYGAKPSENGEFRLEGLDPGPNRLKVFADTCVGVYPAVELEAGRVLDMGDIRLKKLPRFHVRGRVVNEAGVPVPGARVYSPKEEVVAGADGAFDFSPFSKGKAILHAIADGYRESGQTYCADGAVVELVVRELGPLYRFCIVDGETAEPLGGASLRVRERYDWDVITLGNGSTRYGTPPGTNPTGAPAPPESESGADGRLDVHLLAGADDVHIKARGYVAQDLVVAELPSDGEVQRIELQRPRGGFAIGSVPDELGLAFPCAIEIHALERYDVASSPGRDRDEGWSSPPPSAVGAAQADQLLAWLGEEPVLRLKGRHRLYTDAAGKFRFRTNGRTLLRAVAYPSPTEGDSAAHGSVAVSGLICPGVDESLDVGPLVATQLGTLRGRVVLPVPALAPLVDLHLDGRDDLTLKLTNDGEFALGGLIPGRYRMLPRSLPDGVPAESFRRNVTVEPGDGSPLIVDPGLGEFGEVSFTLSVNGAPPEESYCVRLLVDDVDYFDCSDRNPRNAVDMFLPVGSGYRVFAEPDAGELHNAGFELLDRFEVVPGQTQVHLEVESCHLVCSVPAKRLERSASRWQMLRWKDSTGKEREPIEAGIHVAGDQVANAATGRIDVEFPYVPVGAQDLRLEIQPRGDDGATNAVRLPFEADLVPGERVQVELD